MFGFKVITLHDLLEKQILSFQACHEEIKDINLIRKCKCKNFVTGLLAHSVLKSTQMAASLTGDFFSPFPFPNQVIYFLLHKSPLHAHCSVGSTYVGCACLTENAHWTSVWNMYYVVIDDEEGITS